MELKEMVVMTKSSKYGNYCVAGIDMRNGQWIRLVTDDQNSYGAVADRDLICEDGTEVEVLDVIAVPVLERCGDGIQPENYLLDTTKYIDILKQISLDEVLEIHPPEDKKNILGNEYAYITDARVDQVGYSLTIVEVVNLKISQEENPEGKPKTKAKFMYKGVIYENMSVTDYRFYSVPNGTTYGNAIIVVSIGTPYKNKYYKFISAIYV